MRTLAPLLMLLLTGAPIVAADAKPPTLEKALLEQGPRVIEFLKKQKYQNVGVLKFQARKDGKLTDNVGPLNHTLARRLEVALVLADDEDKPIGIIQDATAVAAATSGANHLTARGRAKLFEPKYPLAWGKTKVAADAFVTGVATLGAKRDQMMVQLFVFAKDGSGLKELGDPFPASMDLKTLEDSGESYNLRGLFDGGEIKHTKPSELLAKAQTEASKVKEEKSTHPLQAKDAPVELVILYDGQPQRVDVVDGQARVREPREGQKVTLLIRKKNADDAETYGIVVKVNGRNTLFREQEVAELCHKWLLTRTHLETTIRGYQDSDTEINEFRVASPEESRENEIRYGDDVGTIHMVVFAPEKRGVPKDLPGSEKEAVDVAALTRGALPGKKPDSLAALKDKLAEIGEATVKSRGLLEEGAKTPGNVERLTFTPNPVPVTSLTIFYYQKQPR